MTSPDTRRSTCSQVADSGLSPPGSPAGRTVGRSGPGRARVSPSRSRAGAEVRTIRGTCGPTSFASSVPAGPLSLWENRLRERLATVGSTEYALIWKVKATPAGRSISRLAPWMPPTSVSGSIGSPWRSSTAGTNRGGSYADPAKALARMNSGHTINLEDEMVVAGWSTPRASDGEKGGPNMSFGAGGQPLPAQMHKASPRVTPSARDWKDSPGMATVAEDGRVRLDQLPRQMAAASTWPTPTLADVQGGRKTCSGARSGEMLMASWTTPSARDWKDSAGMAVVAEDGRVRLDQLPRQMAAASTWPTLDASLGGPDPLTRKTGLSTQTYMARATTAPSGPTPNGSSATTTRRGAPNPEFAFWLMGFPNEWVCGVLRAMQSLSRLRRPSSLR